jgi:hypothetical protein
MLSTQSYDEPGSSPIKCFLRDSGEICAPAGVFYSLALLLRCTCGCLETLALYAYAYAVNAFLARGGRLDGSLPMDRITVCCEFVPGSLL